jgi:multiple antibiotic resistance protein
MNFLTAFLALFFIANPVGNIPLFITLTCQQTPREQLRDAWVASLVVAIVLIISLYCGEMILAAFRIQIHAFSLAGSLVIGTLAWSMLHIQQSRQRQTPQESEEASSRDSVAIVPLGIPILAGPGAISTVITFTSNTPSFRMLGIWVILAVALAVAVILSLAPKIQASFGATGMNVFTRLFGLLLLAVAIGNAANAIKALFPVLGR